MIKIAIVEDDRIYSSQTKNYLEKYAKENGCEFDIDVYEDALVFLDSYKFADIVLMDIQMPHIDGLRAAKELRKMDENAVLIFITNYIQFAIKGYEVNALDYIVKPYTYIRFSTLIKKAVRQVMLKGGEGFFIRSEGNVCKIYPATLLYVQIREHLLEYHTESGVVETWGTLKKALEGLPQKDFVCVSRAYIVNMKYVKGTIGNNIQLINGEMLPLSERKRKEFIDVLSKYVGG